MRARNLAILGGFMAAILCLKQTAMALSPWDELTPGTAVFQKAPETDYDANRQADSQVKQGEDILYADDAATPAPESPNIHGFAALTVSTDYITPRGLVVADTDTVLQPIVGLVFPIGDIGFLKNFTFVGGIWNCITYDQHDPHVGAWNELDDFFSLSADVLPNLNATATYVAFNSPTGAYSTEHNSDLKLSYNDSHFWGGNFGIHPYVDLWWAMAGNSTVVLGKNGSTGYIELGIVPTYTVKAIPNLPITLTLPTHISVGPQDYWSYNGAPSGGTWGDGNVGVFTTAFDASVPLNFIPTKYGYWHVDAAINYFDLIDNALVASSTILTGNTRRDLLMGTITLGVNF